MAGQIRFYTDENVSWAVIKGLRIQGADVVSAPDAGMLGRSDEEHLALAGSLGRVLFTHDRDFLRLDSQGVAHTGIAFIHQRHSISRMIDSLMQIHEVVAAEDMIGHVEYV